MMSLSSYLEYEDKVINMLKNIISKRMDPDNIFQSHYRYKYKDRVLEFDLVELSNNQIKNVYEIKTPNAIHRNINFIKSQLLQYKNATHADVYLVYLDEEKKLKIIPLTELEKQKEKKENTFRIVESFSEFYDSLKQVLMEGNDELEYFFRGHSKHIFEPIPSIYRKGYIKYEDKMYYEAIRRNPSKFSEGMSTFDNLVKMQHYELPTRLLDITTNPLIALYFACKEYKDNDGEVLIFPMINEQIKNYESDAVCILANLAKQPIKFMFTDNQERLVYDIRKDEPNFKGEYLEAEAIKKVFCVRPRLNNERIIRQQGAFFIFGMGDSKDKPAQFADNPIRIRISATSKSAILRDLQIFGINEATIFPETDKIMKQIKAELKR